MSTLRVFTATVETKLGAWLIAGTSDGLCFLGLEAGCATEKLERCFERREGEVLFAKADGELDVATLQLHEYADGSRRAFDLPLDLCGSEFELGVWAALQDIPFGETRTYGELARAVGDAGAARAVGGANGRNPLPVVVPCHRVVAADGLGGFSGGAGIKERLLAHEGTLLFG